MPLDHGRYAERVVLVDANGNVLNNSADGVQGTAGPAPGAGLLLYDGSNWQRGRAIDENAGGHAPTVFGQRVSASMRTLDTVGNVYNRVRGNPDGDPIVQLRDTIGITVTAAVNTLTTLTIPATAGKFNYLAYLSIVMYAAAALTGGATPVLVTTTGLTGTPSFTFPTGQAIGTISEQKYEGAHPIKGTAVNTAMTIVGPATANVIWRITAAYFVS